MKGPMREMRWEYKEEEKKARNKEGNSNRRWSDSSHVKQEMVTLDEVQEETAQAKGSKRVKSKRTKNWVFAFTLNAVSWQQQTVMFYEKKKENRKKKKRTEVRMSIEVPGNKGRGHETALTCTDSSNSSFMWKENRKERVGMRGKQKRRQCV